MLATGASVVTLTTGACVVTLTTGASVVALKTGARVVSLTTGASVVALKTGACVVTLGATVVPKIGAGKGLGKLELSSGPFDVIERPSSPRFPLSSLVQ